LQYLKEIQLGMSCSNLAQDLAKEEAGTFMNLLYNLAQFWKMNVAILLPEHTKQ